MCCADNVELAQLLLEAGAKPDAQNAQGQTALDVATSLDELERSSPWLDVFDTSQWLVHIGNRPTGRPRLIVVEQRVQKSARRPTGAWRVQRPNRLSLPTFDACRLSPRSWASRRPPQSSKPPQRRLRRSPRRVCPRGRGRARQTATTAWPWTGPRKRTRRQALRLLKMKPRRRRPSWKSWAQERRRQGNLASDERDKRHARPARRLRTDAKVRFSERAQNRVEKPV